MAWYNPFSWKKPDPVKQIGEPVFKPGEKAPPGAKVIAPAPAISRVPSRRVRKDRDADPIKWGDAPEAQPSVVSALPPGTSVISAYTPTQRVKDVSLYYGKKFFDLTPEIPSIKETKVSPFIHEVSPTGTGGTYATRYRTQEELPPTQAFEYKTSELQTSAFIGAYSRQAILQSQVSKGEVDVEQAQKTMDKYISDANKKLQTSFEGTQKEFAVKKAKYEVPYSAVVGVGIGAISVIAPPLGYAYLVGTAGKTAFNWDAVKSSYSFSPKAFAISTGSFVGGGLVGGGLAGIGKRSYVKSHYLQELKTAKVDLIGKEFVISPKVLNVGLVGKTKIMGKDIFITSEQIIKQTGEKVSVGRQQVRIISPEKAGIKILGFEGVSPGKILGKTKLIQEFKSGLKLTGQLGKGFKASALTRPTYQAFIPKPRYSFLRGAMVVKATIKQAPGSYRFDFGRFGGVTTELQKGFAYTRSGALRGTRIYKKGGISEIYGANIRTLVKRVKPKTEKDFLSFMGGTKKSSQEFLKGLYQQQAGGVGQVVSVAGKQILKPTIKTKPFVSGVVLGAGVVKVRQKEIFKPRITSFEKMEMRGFEGMKMRGAILTGTKTKQIIKTRLKQRPSQVSTPIITTLPKMSETQMSGLGLKTALKQIQPQKEKTKLISKQSFAQRFISPPIIKIGTPFYPYFPTFSDARRKKQKVFRVRLKLPKSRYTPSFKSAALGITAPSIPKSYFKGFGAIGVRPIIVKRKKKKVRVKKKSKVVRVRRKKK